MRVGMALSYTKGFRESVDELADYEAAGLDMVTVAELYTFDAVSQLGYLAARTRTLTIASAVMQLYTRTPTLIATTAAGLDFVSDGRFELGLGASGPQVIEGFHGVPYDAPVERTREVIDICRMVWRREPVVYRGRHYQIPLPEGQGSGLARPLKLINKPVRERIPISLAAIGPRNVELAAEAAEGWQPAFFVPEQADAVWGGPLAAGLARRDPALPPLDVAVRMPLAIGDDVRHLRRIARRELALYLGGMGARNRNFYNRLAVRYGFAEAAATVQELYLAGRRDEAAAAVPEELVAATCLIGPAGWVADRVAACAAAGVTTLHVTPIARTHADRVRLVEQVRAYAAK
ncbi:LLM class F420-dependent oxidoreductase [Micromonospora sp. R77]|uniref:LLM class F420-dependent oxidoreductase n=1 Tax=Micromonospora sp. R77 TaxID=2925836 RepID=UPI001F61C41A|nr:LLM class F420-dependent oxidoreductase [Micromonospora sp. R77]MCI4066476.1 LLM class F420-dependent oxidoreductase [Micromonospora sp. R77]